jgi:hypothetical protein
MTAFSNSFATRARGCGSNVRPAKSVIYASHSNTPASGRYAQIKPRVLIVKSEYSQRVRRIGCYLNVTQMVGLGKGRDKWSVKEVGAVPSYWYILILDLSEGGGFDAQRTG